MRSATRSPRPTPNWARSNSSTMNRRSRAWVSGATASSIERIAGVPRLGSRSRSEANRNASCSSTSSQYRCPSAWRFFPAHAMVAPAGTPSLAMSRARERGFGGAELSAHAERRTTRGDGDREEQRLLRLCVPLNHFQNQNHVIKLPR